MSDVLMTIREMCDEFKVTPRTLRFYEAKELIFPIRTGQKRSYTHQDRGRLKLMQFSIIGLTFFTCYTN